MWAGETLFSRSLRDPSFPGQCIEADAMLCGKAIFVKKACQTPEHQAVIFEKCKILSGTYLLPGYFIFII